MIYLVNVYFVRFETMIYVTANLLLPLLVILKPYWVKAHPLNLFSLQGARMWASELEKTGVSV